MIHFGSVHNNYRWHSLHLTLLLALVGCGDSSDPGGLGSIEVQTTTVGDFADPDGYQVTVDDVQAATVPATGAFTIENQSAGNRSVRLVGVADFCTAGGDNPKVVTVPAGATVTVTFSVLCSAPNGSGSVRVQVTTTGGDIDPDGYQVDLPDPPVRVASNGSVVVTGLTPGEFQIVIEDIAPNCAFVGEGQTTVTVPPLSQAQVDYTMACLGPLSNDIAFAASAGDGSPADVFRANASGARVVNLTNSPDGEGSPSWSPDGSRIAFLRQVGNEVHLFVMDADGTNAIDLNVVNVSDPAWSPDGTKLAVFESKRGGNVFVVNSDGTGLMQVTNKTCQQTAECGVTGPPTWSPDGTRLTYSESFGIIGPPTSCFVIGVDGTNNTLVKDSCYTPAWSPDGSKIAFAGLGVRPDNMAGDILLMNPDGSETVDLSVVAGSEGTDTAPVWSPDGSQLAFLSNRNVLEEPSRPGYKIFIMNADGTGVRHVTLVSEFPGGTSRPTWSPVLP